MQGLMLEKDPLREHTDRQITGKNWGQNVAPHAGLVKVAQLCPAICNSTDYTTQGILQAKWAFSSPGDLPKPGIEPRSPALWGDSFPSEPPGKAVSSPRSPHCCPRCSGLRLCSLLPLEEDLATVLEHCRVGVLVQGLNPLYPFSLSFHRHAHVFGPERSTSVCDPKPHVPCQLLLASPEPSTIGLAPPVIMSLVCEPL